MSNKGDYVGTNDGNTVKAQAQMEAMVGFLDSLADQAALLRGHMPGGVARDYADEIIDLIVDAKIDLQENRKMLFAGVATKTQLTHKEDPE